MWCKSCRQDVPGIASTVEGHYCCARCAEILTPATAADSTATPNTPTTTADVANSLPVEDANVSASDRLAEMRFSALPSIDDWELDEQLKHVERLLAAFRPPSARQSTLHPIEEHIDNELRVDPSVEKPSQQSPLPTESPRPRTIWALLVWPIIAAGWTALACGGALAGWGWYIHRDDFWKLGLPILFGGQLGLLVGLMLQLLLTVKTSRPIHSTADAAHDNIHPASHSTTSVVDRRLARMQRQIDGFTQRFDPRGT